MVSGGSFFGGAAGRSSRKDHKIGRPEIRAVPVDPPRPNRDETTAAMTFITDILASLFGFDIVKLSARLDTLEHRRDQILLVLFTLMADTIRFFLVTCIFVLILY
jgi:hypothetical protein